MMLLLDWEIARRNKSSIMEYVALSWKSPGPSHENRAYHWDFVPHCKLNIFLFHLSFLFSFKFFYFSPEVNIQASKIKF